MTSYRLALLLAVGLTSCAESSPPEILRESSEFVGGLVCVECHQNQVELWQNSHHDLAMQAANSNTVLGNFEGTPFTYAGVTSTFFTREDEFWVRTDGPDGALQDYRIAYTFGVYPLQQYLIEFPGGRYQALGIAWDARTTEQGGQRWFHLYPDEDITHEDALHWTGPNQNWNYMCAECHSTNLLKGYSVDQDRYQTTWAEMDVSCEACHGPASRHLAWAKATAQGDQAEDSVLQGLEISFRAQPDMGWAFDPGATTARRSHTRSSRTEIETCARCHSRRSVLKQDYQHGRLLMDSHRPALLRTPLYHPDGQIQEEVYVYGSFLQSKMYQAGVTCTDCHDPHSLQLDSPDNNLCTRCHQAQSYESRDHHFHEPGTPAATCVECHMPAQTYMVIDPRRDHSLRVPRPDLSLTLGTPNACNDCHSDRPAKWAAEQVKEWYGSDRETHYGEALYAGEHGLAGAGETLAELVQDSDQPAIVRASALSLLSGYPGGLPTSSLQRLLQEIDPLLRHSALLVVEQLEPRIRLDLAFPLLSDPILTVRIEAARVLAGGSPELMTTSQQHRHREVLEEYRKAQMATAERPESHMNLGNLHLQLGEWSLAEQEYQTALRIDPAFIPAYVNLADQYRVQGREQEAEEILLRGQEGSDHADLHHAMGLLLVRQQRLSEAILSLEKAARQEPGVARYSYVYGVALQSAGREREALNVLRSAQKRHPNDREILWALVTYLVQSGSPQEALGYAEKLKELFPQDPQIQNLIRNLDPGR